MNRFDQNDMRRAQMALATGLAKDSPSWAAGAPALTLEVLDQILAELKTLNTNLTELLEETE